MVDPGVINYNRDDTCYQQNEISDHETKSRFEVSNPGRYFVSMHGYVKNYENNRVVMKMVEVEDGSEISLLWPFVDHEADDDGSYVGGSPVNGLRIPYIAKGGSIKTYLHEANGDSKITS